MCLIRRDEFPAKQRSVKDTNSTKASNKETNHNYNDNDNMNKRDNILNNKQDAHPQAGSSSSKD